MSIESEGKTIKSPERVRVIEKPNGVYEGMVEIRASHGEREHTVHFEIIPHDQRIYIRPEHRLSDPELKLVNQEIADVGKIYQFDTSSFEMTVHLPSVTA